jgi:hypothetical protein
MIKVVRTALLSFALICGTTGVALAFHPPLLVDPHATYQIPGTEDFITGYGKVEANSYPDVQRHTPPAATQNAHRLAAVQQNAPLGR